MASYRQQSEWTAQQALAYITGLEAADEQSQYEAFATAYNYFMMLSKKKISWSVHLQKLAYEFIELAFDNNKHSSIKDVLKAYRSLTQGQYSESLKDVLEHYRDRKLESILEQDFLHENLDLIISLPNIENEQASSTVIFSSFKPDQKKKIEELKSKLKIVWEGYKYIIETVRINQKLQDVYKDTLAKVFSFVDKYNRKHQLKSFCRTLRSGLNTAFSKRDRTEQQKGFYIDIEKNDVNDRNIDIRLEQFKVTIKLGLWQQAFQVLEDINNLMKVRKGPVKSKIKFKYYENLAILFKKSNYWHYHAFAYYNYFLAAQKNPNLTAKERKQFSDKLLLSVICIPPVTHESNQSKESQRKISAMMISSTKIPSKQQLFDIIVSAGIMENASAQIKNLWNFMFLEFDLSSLTKGLNLLNEIKQESYSEFKCLIEDILIYKQLLSISEIYQRIKIESLLTMIPLPRQKIEKILLDSYHQKLLDFVMDENQKIIIFEDKNSEKSSNPTQNFLNIYIDLALQKQKQRKMDGDFIIKKAENFLEEAEDYYWKIRLFKIEQYRKKLKKPKQQLVNEAYRKKKLEQQEREREQFQKKLREQEAQRLAEEKKRQFGTKKIIISDIKEIKQHRVVRIIGKKIEDLTDDEIENITIDTLNKHLEETKTKIQNNKEAKYRKAFNHVDYLERERRVQLEPRIRQAIPSKEEQEKEIEQINKNAVKDFESRKLEKQRIQKMMQYLEPKINEESKKMSEKYDSELLEFKQRLNDYFREKIINRAKNIAAENKRKKEQQERRMRQAQTDYDYMNTKWTFKAKTVASSAEAQKPIGFKMGAKRDNASSASTQSQSDFNNSNNVFEKLEGMNDDKPTTTGKWGRKKVEEGTVVEEKKEQPKGKWGRKEDKKEQEPQVNTQTNSFVPPPSEKKTFGMGMGLGDNTQKKSFGMGGFGKKDTTNAQKEEKPRAPKKGGYVNVN